MKLIYRISIRVLIALTIILSIWALFFYFVIINEVYDEIDDNLEDYSEVIISKFNMGDSLPDRDNGTNNSYHIELLSESYIDIERSSIFVDDMVYIDAKGETEPARILKTMFRADDGKSYRLLVYTPSIEHEDMIEAILYSIIYLFISLLIMVIVINIWVYKTSMSPMYKILEWLKGYKIEGENSPLDNSTDIVEFQRLNDAIKLSIITIERSYLAQKEFIGNASHEMQTPLAICQARLEAMLEMDLTEQQLGEIIKTQRTIDYMKRLNKALLLLSRIENHQFIEVEDVNFNAIIEDLASDFKDIYSSQEIELNIVSSATLVVNMNIILAKALIINLIKNAFVHNVPSGSVTIKLFQSKLVVENSGESALDSAQIFKRFYQGKKSSNSTGLGLAIVHTICKESKFVLGYSYVGRSHIFTITF